MTDMLSSEAPLACKDPESPRNRKYKYKPIEEYIAACDCCQNDNLQMQERDRGRLPGKFLCLLKLLQGNSMHDKCLNVYAGSQGIC